MESIGIGLLIPLLETLGNTESSLPIAESEGAFNQITSFIINGLGISGSIVSLLITIVVLFIMKAIFRFLAMAYIGSLRGRLLFEIKTHIFSYYSSLEYVEYAKKNTGDMVNLLNVQTVRALQAFHFCNAVVMSIVSSVIYLFVAALISIEFGIMVVIGGGVIMLFMSLVNKYILSISRDYTREGGILAKLVIQTMTGFKYLIATDQISSIKPKVIESINKLSSSTSRLSIASAFSSSLTEPVSVILIVSIIFIQVKFYNLPIEPILISLLLFYKGLTSASSIQENYQQALTHIGSIELIVEETSAKINTSKSKKLHIHKINQRISLKNINFTYTRKSKKIIDNLSIEIPTKNIVAIVGESGSGKTTLVDIIIGIISKQKGDIYIDDVKIEDIDKNSWRQLIGYISQDEFVFDDTVANNITFWEGDWKEDESLHDRIKLALKKSDLYETIKSLPKGLDTVIGDRGVLLSGGQKQRLFIAREIFRSPELLIFDEATSALDYNSEISISEAINNMRGSVTIIIIAHRLKTIKFADIIYVLKDGKIEEQGSFQELLKNDGGYISEMASSAV
jgi:ABC-type bacteriocin/lantibiotic exporter with double-glycine peptidase domain